MEKGRLPDEVLAWTTQWAAWWRESVGGLLFPTDCQVCQNWSEHGPYCSACREELLAASESSCPRCALPVGPWAHLDRGCGWCRGRALGFDATVALGPYTGPIRDACLRIKRRSGLWLARWLADLVYEAHEGKLAASDAVGIVPVPLHWRRQWERGFNQAEILARRLAERLELPLQRPLRRVQHTPKLAQKHRTERAQLLRTVFNCRPDPRLSGRTVLLVDDIMTTGATCGAAARALKRAGARRVVVVVVARTERVS